MFDSLPTSLSASAHLQLGLGEGAASRETTLACRFYVKVDGLHHAVFTEVAGLSMEMDVTEVEEGGNNHAFHRLPGRLKPGNITLKRGISRGNDLFNWMLSCASAGVQRRDLSILLYGADGSVQYQWDVTGCYPFRWNCVPFRAGFNEIAIETLDLCYESLRMAALDGGGAGLQASATVSIGGISVTGSASVGLPGVGGGAPSIQGQASVSASPTGSGETGASVSASSSLKGGL